MRIYAKISSMNEIKRDIFLKKLMNSRHNNMIKVVTGLRRSGKSYLLFNIFVNALKGEGIDDSHIIQVNLEDRHNKHLRNPDELMAYIDARLCDEKMHYILLDEVQFVAEFEDVLNSYLHVPNADVYVTGSNAKFLSKDVITETSDEAKREYLKKLFHHTYLVDIKERYAIKKDTDLEELVNVLSSSIGGLTNPRKLADTFHSVKKSTISQETIKNYLDFLSDAFLIEKSVRYDIKGKKYIDTPSKYYFEDLGIRNALINFRQIEQTHLMENLIYNELRLRGYEVDFVCNIGYERVYIQSALNLPTAEKQAQEMRPLLSIKDSFKKVVVVGGLQPTYKTDDGVLVQNLFDFLLENDE